MQQPTATTQVRLTWEDGETSESTLEDFLRENAASVTEEEERALRAGDRVTFGGGAAPVVHVEVSRRSATRQASAIGRARRARGNEQELGVRPGVARAFGFGGAEATRAPSDHDPDACDTFGCPTCLDLANRGAA